eukprot:TRINITY_DN66483_c0_g1_i1.p1 TRINITY_DN66483_c0_g1~~TRINITY_DN66483_c0_g1_i1.p1  ORF type:complete len:444 (+),score=239.47 TRINITY_DN66483_c0_g1_i1:120-1451(+)
MTLDEYYKPGGPVFIFLSGEAPMEFFAFQTVQIRNWAQEQGALYINLEHRFYGKSNPVPGGSPYSTDNLRLLSSQQALADAAYFIERYNATKLAQPTDKWIMFGCSYSAGLAAWFRLKYPHIVLASIAPSGPVQATLNYTSFFGQFSNSAPSKCVAAAGDAAQQIQKLAASTDGLAQLSKMFSACAPLTQENTYYFLWTLMTAVGSADQMNNPPTWILNTTCQFLTNTSDTLAGFVKAFNFNQGQEAAAAMVREQQLLRSPAFQQSKSEAQQHARLSTLTRPHSTLRAEVGCNSFDEDAFIKSLMMSNNPNRAWWWQKCVEFGYFKPGYDGTSVFFTNLPVEHIVAYCERIFGIPNMTPHIDATNRYYGGYNLHATNVMFSNGLLDPWHLLSINEGTAPQGVTATDYEAGHCGTLIDATDNDPPSLVASREALYSFIKKQLQD